MRLGCPIRGQYLSLFFINQMSSRIKIKFVNKERSPILQGVRLDWVAASAEISENKKKTTELPLSLRGCERPRKEQELLNQLV